MAAAASQDISSAADAHVAAALATSASGTAAGSGSPMQRKDTLVLPGSQTVGSTTRTISGAPGSAHKRAGSMGMGLPSSQLAPVPERKLSVIRQRSSSNAGAGGASSLTVPATDADGKLSAAGASASGSTSDSFSGSGGAGASADSGSGAFAGAGLQPPALLQQGSLSSSSSFSADLDGLERLGFSGLDLLDDRSSDGPMVSDAAYSLPPRFHPLGLACPLGVLALLCTCGVGSQCG